MQLSFDWLFTCLQNALDNFKQDYEDRHWMVPIRTYELGERMFKKRMDVIEERFWKQMTENEIFARVLKKFYTLEMGSYCIRKDKNNLSEEKQRKIKKNYIAYLKHMWKSGMHGLITGRIETIKEIDFEVRYLCETTVGIILNLMNAESYRLADEQSVHAIFEEFCNHIKENESNPGLPSVSKKKSDEISFKLAIRNRRHILFLESLKARFESDKSTEEDTEAWTRIY